MCGCFLSLLMSHIHCLIYMLIWKFEQSIAILFRILYTLTSPVCNRTPEALRSLGLLALAGASSFSALPPTPSTAKSYITFLSTSHEKYEFEELLWLPILALGVSVAPLYCCILLIYNSISVGEEEGAVSPKEESTNI